MMAIVLIVSSCEQDLLENDVLSVLTAEQAIEKGIGSTKDNALVPFLLKDGHICSREEYYNIVDTDTIDALWFTDLKTFKTVTQMKEATIENVSSLFLNGKILYMFDPYVKSFVHKEMVPKVSLKKKNITWNAKGNIIYGKWNAGKSSKYGHVAGISYQPAICGDIITEMKNTKVIEASPSDEASLYTRLFGGDPNSVFERYMTSNGNDAWCSSLLYDKCSVYYPGMTNTQRDKIVSYMKKQIGKSYQALSSKNNTDSWYCSKLVWKAYKVVLNIDIDDNGGLIVYPEDILNSSYLVGICF